MLGHTAPAAMLQLPGSAATYNHFQAPAILDAEDFMHATPTSSAADDLVGSPKFDMDSLLGLTAPAAVTSCLLPTMAYWTWLPTVAYKLHH